MRFRLLSLASLTLVVTGHPASAAVFQDLAQIDARVTAFAGALIGEPGGARMPVDRKLKLRTCEQALDLSWHGTRGDAVLVQCPDADGWRIFVPINASGHGRAAANIVERRDMVRIEAGGSGFTVMRTGEALEAGGAGDLIRVRLEDDSRRGKVVMAQIEADGRVRVPLR